MAADQERADRIRALKQERPDLTWRRIADYVGVTERSAADWQRKGGIDYDNAQKLADLFEVDIDYIWRGPAEQDRAPSPFAAQDAVADRLDQMEQRISDNLAAALEEFSDNLAAALEEFSQAIRKQNETIEQQNELLARQSEILERIEAALAQDTKAADRIEAATETLGGAAAQLDAQLQETVRSLRSAPPRKPAPKRTTAPKRTPRA